MSASPVPSETVARQSGARLCFVQRGGRPSAGRARVVVPVVVGSNPTAGLLLLLACVAYHGISQPITGRRDARRGQSTSTGRSYVLTVWKTTFGIAAVGISAALLVGSAVAVARPGLKGKSLVRGVGAEISLIKANGTTNAFVLRPRQGHGGVRGELGHAACGKTAVTPSCSGSQADTKVHGDIQVDKGAIVFSRGGTAFAVLAPRAAKPAPFRFGDGQGHGSRGSAWRCSRPGKA